MTQELKAFDALQANIQEFVAPTFLISVTDFKSSDEAIAAVKAVKAYLSEVEDKRKELVGPLNERVKQINAFAKDVAHPLQQAEEFIKAQLVKFSDLQERLRLEELRRVQEVERLAREKAEAARLAAEAELRAKQEAEITPTAAVHDIFGAGDAEDNERALRVEHERQRAEQEQRLAEDEAVRQAEFKQKQYEIEQQRIKGVKKVWKCEMIDVALVPEHFLIIELNTQAVLAAARGGTTVIPGVRLWQDSSVAVGRNTYVPKAALGVK